MARDLSVLHFSRTRSRPVGHREVGPVVVALFQLGPGVLQDLLPGLVAEQLPERGGGDLDAVVVVRAIGLGDCQQGVAQLDQFELEGLERLEVFSSSRDRALPLVRRAATSWSTCFSFGSMKSLTAVKRVWSVRLGSRARACSCPNWSRAASRSGPCGGSCCTA